MKALEKLRKKKVSKLFSHYKVFKSTKGGYYSFTTKNGVYYRCLFYQNAQNLFGLEVESPIYYFSFFKPKSSDCVEFDKHVGQTIVEILNRFFKKNPNSIICYICDNSDLKAIRRQNSFEKWFSKNNSDHEKALIKGEIPGVIYLGAVMLSVHEEKLKIKTHFDDELRKLLSEEKQGTISLLQ